MVDCLIRMESFFEKLTPPVVKDFLSEFFIKLFGILLGRRIYRCLQLIFHSTSAYAYYVKVALSNCSISGSSKTLNSV